MLKYNLTLAENPAYALPLILHLVNTQDFLEGAIQKDLLSIATKCIQTLKSNDCLFKRYVSEKAPQLVTMVAVKEFMIDALDDSVLTQMRLKDEFKAFFDMIKKTPGYMEAERQADEGSTQA